MSPTYISVNNNNTPNKYKYHERLNLNTPSNYIIKYGNQDITKLSYFFHILNFS